MVEVLKGESPEGWYVDPERPFCCRACDERWKVGRIYITGISSSRY